MLCFDMNEFGSTLTEERHKTNRRRTDRQTDIHKTCIIYIFNITNTLLFAKNLNIKFA